MQEVPDCQADRPNGTFTAIVSEIQRSAVHRVPGPGQPRVRRPRRRTARDTPGIAGIAAVGRFYLYRPAVTLGRHPAPPARQTGLRAAVNARLEEISFRTGLITAAIALVALIAAAGFYATTLGDGSATVTVSAASVPKTAPKAPAAALSTPATPSATAKPKPHKARPAHPASAPPAVTIQSQAQAPGSAGGWPGDGRNPSGYGQGTDDDGPGFGGRGFNGEGPDKKGFGGHGPRHGDPGFPGSRGFSGFGHGRGRDH